MIFEIKKLFPNDPQSIHTQSYSDKVNSTLIRRYCLFWKSKKPIFFFAEMGKIVFI